MVKYQAALLVTALAFLAVSWSYGIGNVYAVAGLAIVAAIAERGRVRLTNEFWVTISVLPTVFAAAMFGPLAAMVVAALSYVGDFPVAIFSFPLATGTGRGKTPSAGGSLRASALFMALRLVWRLSRWPDSRAIRRPS